MYRVSTIISVLLVAVVSPLFSQQPTLVGTCEGCEAVFDSDFSTISATDTLPGYLPDDSAMKISGTVVDKAGDPAQGVVIYLYHTDRKGLYSHKDGAKGWERKHGSIRGWVKTDENGRYTFFTNRPGAYPQRTEPAHIHAIVYEPDGKYYWITSYTFEGDPLLAKSREKKEARGGPGVLRLQEKDGLLTGQRDIVLGMNIPGYPGINP